MLKQEFFAKKCYAICSGLREDMPIYCVCEVNYAGTRVRFKFAANQMRKNSLDKGIWMVIILDPYLAVPSFFDKNR